MYESLQNMKYNELI